MFGWRNGSLEDAILSSDDYGKIFNLLTSTDQETIEDLPSGSKKGTGKGKQTKAKGSQRSKVADQETIEDMPLGSKKVPAKANKQKQKGVKGQRLQNNFWND